MKKSLLLLFSLLIFVGNAWGADCYLLGPTSEDHFSTISSKEYEIDLTKGEAYQLSYEAMCVPILGFWGGELYAAQYVNGKWEDIHNETPPKKSYKSFGPYNINPAATKIKLYTKTGATGHKYFKNVKVTQKKYFTITSATSHNFGNVVYDDSSTESWTVNYKYSSKSVKVSSNSSAFVVSQGTAGDATCGKTGTGSFTVTFKPTKLGENTGTITVGSATISVSGIGTPPIPTNLNATEEFLQSTLSWSGANNSYYQVYNGSTLLYEGKNNSYPWTGRQWGTSYTFSVKACTAKDTNCSDAASKTFSTKTLLAPAGVSVSNIDYDNATITWSSATAATSYVVYVDDEFYTETTETTCQITGISLGEDHTTKVESKLNNKETTTASEIPFTTYDLQAPLTVVADQEHTSYSSVPLLWDAVTDATGYCIVNKTSGEVVTVSGQTTNSYLMNGLEMNTRYSFNVYPLYNGQRSKHYRTSNVVVTKKMDIDLTDCMIYENTTEQEFFMSSGESYYPDNNGYVMPKDERVQYTQKLTFQIKKNLGYVGRIYDVRLYIKVGDKWQDSYIWNGNDLWTDGSSVISPDYQSQDYKTVTVTLPKNVTAIRFRGSSFSGLPTEWAKYGGNKRYIKDVRVYTMAEAEVSPQDINYNLYIGQKESKTFNLKYSNRADVKFNIDNPLFNVNFPSLTSCTVGNKDISVSFKPETLDSPVQGSISIMNGDFATVALNATVKALPAPENFKVSGTTSQSVTLTWDDVNITETDYKVICKQGDNVTETKNLGGDATTCTFEGLQPNKEYTYIITTMYNSIENESAEITGKTNMLPAPQNFALDVTSVRAFSARFTWNKVAEATGYKLEWQWNEEVAAQTATVGDVSEYKITELEPDTKYSVKITTLYGDEEHGASGSVDVTTTCVINTIAAGDEPTQQLHTITLLSGEQLDDLSFVKGSTIKFKSYTNSTNIKFVQLNVTINGSKVSYSVPEIEIEVSSNVFIESVYEYAGIAQVVDEHGEVIYGTLTDAVNAAEEGAVINLLGDVAQDMVVSKYIKFNGNGHDIDNLYINKDGNVELTGDVTVVKDFGLEVSAARSGQFLENGGQIEVTGKAYVDKTFDASGTSKGTTWYSLAVPFPVSVANGMFILANNKETAAHAVSDIDIFQYDGAVRAQTISGRPSDDAWVSVTNGYLQPGVFYLVGLPKGGNTFRFYKAEGEELITISKNVDLYEYPAVNPLHGGWNGIGNSQLYHVGVTFNSTGYAQILDTNNKFVTVDLGESSFAVTTPMFIQSAEDATATFSFKNSGKLRSASAGSATYNLRIAREGANEFADQMFVSASSEATGSYTIGKDLAKFEVSTAYPQIYTSAYNVSLSVHEAAYNEKNIADMPLYIYIPEAGNYTLSLGKDVLDGTTLYLVKDGVEIHNFNTDGAYTLYLAKGKNTSYSLRIAGSEIEDVPTPAAETEANGTVKVYVKEHTLCIEGLAEGETYTVGNMIRSLYSGKSNGNIVRLPLDQQGVYWVKAGEKGVKVLNK